MYPIFRSVGGSVLVNNERESPFGAGWTLDGLQRLHPQADGSMVLTTGDGHEDVVVANGLSGDLSVLLGDGIASFSPETRYAVTQPSSNEEPVFRALRIADLDDNTTLDLDLTAPGTNPGQGVVSVRMGTGVPAEHFASPASP